MYIFTHRIEGFLSIKDVFHSIIRKYIPPELTELISDAMLSNITEFRCLGTGSQDESTSKKVKNIIEALKTCLYFSQQCKFYLKPFEAQFLIQTKEFFERVSSDLDLLKLIVFAKESKEKEKQLFECGLLKNTYDSVKAMFNSICLEGTQESILDSPVFFEIISNHDIEQLKEIAKLYSETDDLKKIIYKYFAMYWSNTIASVLDTSPKQDWIETLIQIALDSVKITSIIFGSSKTAIKTVNDQMRHTIKSKDKSDKIESLLARYIDSGKNFDAGATTLLHLIEGSECFEASYSYLLRKRILDWNISFSREKNIAMILEKEIGRENTQRINELINDYNVSVGIKQPHLEGVPFDYRCLWLHSTNWPVEKEQAVFPETIQTLNKMLRDKMQKADKPVNVFFPASLASCIMSYGEKELKMSGEQAIIILKLQENHSAPMSIVDLSHELNLSDTNVEENLKIIGDFHIVREESGKFSINPENILLPEEQTELPKPKIGKSEMKRAMDEGNATIKRENAIKCKIVSVLKEFKQLKLQDLLQKVKKEINFTLDQQKFIEILNKLCSQDFVGKRSTDTYCYNT